MENERPAFEGRRNKVTAAGGADGWLDLDRVKIFEIIDAGSRERGGRREKRRRSVE